MLRFFILTVLRWVFFCIERFGSLASIVVYTQLELAILIMRYCKSKIWLSGPKAHDIAYRVLGAEKGILPLGEW